MSDLVFYYGAHSRSFATAMLLEELEAPHQRIDVNLAKGEQKKPEIMAKNPMGKTPMIVHLGEVVTEQPAIFTYLCEAFPEKKLAPMPGEAGRGSFLRWLAYYGDCFEPMINDRSLNRDGGNAGRNGYGSYEDVVKTVTEHLEANRYFLGERFSALDILWARGLFWATGAKLMPATDVVTRYIEASKARPSYAKVQAMDETIPPYEQEKKSA